MIIWLKTNKDDEKSSNVVVVKHVDGFFSQVPKKIARKSTSKEQKVKATCEDQAKKDSSSKGKVMISTPNNNISEPILAQSVADLLNYLNNEQEDSNHHWNQLKRPKLWIPEDLKDF